jgi:signal transduction histidine kinase
MELAGIQHLIKSAHPSHKVSYLEPMKKYLLFFLLSSSWACNLKAQDPRLADSLRTRLATLSIRDTTYLDLLNKLEIALIFSDPGGECLKLSKISIHLADSLKDSLRLGKAYNISANCYKNSGLIDKAMDESLKAIAIFKAIGDLKWEANLHNNIALMYLSNGDMELCKKELEQSMNIRNEIKFYKGISGLYNSMGNMYDQLGEPKESLRYYKLALDSLGEGGSPYDRFTYLSNVGNSYGRLGDYKTCRKYNQEALVLHLQMGLNQETTRDLHNIGEAWLKENQLDSAEHYLLWAFQLADSIRYHLVIHQSSVALKQLYENRNQFETALKWADIMYAEADTLHRLQQFSESEARQTAYRVEQQESEDKFKADKELLKKDESLKRQQILNWSLGGGIVLLGGFGFVTMRRYREKKQANHILEKRVEVRTAALKTSNARLQEEMEQKEQAGKTLNSFIYRSSHDLKGPLTSIMGLVDVGKKEAGSTAYLDHIDAKIRQLDGVLQQLIDKVEVDARSVVHTLVDWHRTWKELNAELESRAGYAKTKMNLVVETNDPIISDPVLIKIGLRHLLQNAIDFRSQDKVNEIVVKITNTSAPKWTLSVTDNGIGIPEDQLEKVWEMNYRGSNASSGAGLGLYLVSEMAKKLGGKVSLQSQIGKGTTISLTIGGE